MICREGVYQLQLSYDKMGVREGVYQLQLSYDKMGVVDIFSKTLMLFSVVS